MHARDGARPGESVDGGSTGGDLDAYASALVAGAYAGGVVETASARAPVQAQATPERDAESVEPGHPGDPLDPRKGHRPKPTEPLPVDAPPVPKLRPLE